MNRLNAATILALAAAAGAGLAAGKRPELGLPSYARDITVYRGRPVPTPSQKKRRKQARRAGR